MGTNDHDRYAATTDTQPRPIDSSDEIFTAADTLTRLRAGWVAVALVAKVVSYLLRGRALAVVLRAGTAALAADGTRAAGGDDRDVVDGTRSAGPGGHPAGPPGSIMLGAATLAGDAAAYCLPMGFAASGVIMIGFLRRRGVDAVLAGWMFAICTSLYVGSISVLTLVAVRVAGDDDPVPRMWPASTLSRSAGGPPWPGGRDGRVGEQVGSPQAAHPLASHQPGGHPGTPGRAPSVCLVAYEGTFRADSIPGARPAAATGRHILIFLWVRHTAVQRILVTDALPASAHRPWWHS